MKRLGLPTTSSIRRALTASPLAEHQFKETGSNNSQWLVRIDFVWPATTKVIGHGP